MKLTQRRLAAGLAVIASSVTVGWFAVGVERLLFAVMLLLVSVLCLTAIHFTCPRPRELFWLSPMGLLLAYLALATGVVPVLWGIGWAAPWSEITAHPYSAAGVATLVLTCATAGVFVGMPKVSMRRASLASPEGGLTTALVYGLLVGLLGYAGLARAAGGAGVLLHSLSDRRTLLAGTGPFRIFITVTAMACVYGVLHRDKTSAQRFLTIFCGLVYGILTLLTGSRFQAIVLIVAVVCAISRSVGVGRRTWILLTLGTLSTIPLSTLYALRVRAGLTYGETFSVFQPGTSKIFSILNPFVQGGLDVIRTTGVVLNSLPILRFQPQLYIGSIANLVPRALWSGKPAGSATQFSETYFPLKWAAGTGVPPSVGVEVLFTFGLVGGLLAIAALMFLLTRLVLHASNIQNVFWMVLVPYLSADFVQFAKGGSDGFLRTLTLHGFAVLIMVGIARLTGGRVITSAPIKKESPLPREPKVRAELVGTLMPSRPGPRERRSRVHPRYGRAVSDGESSFGLLTTTTHPFAND
jgi:hypothetical protein